MEKSSLFHIKFNDSERVFAFDVSNLIWCKIVQNIMELHFGTHTESICFNSSQIALNTYEDLKKYWDRKDLTK